MFSEKKRLDRLEDDLSQQRRRIDDLASAQKRVTLDNAELYEKTLRLMQRMAKRYAVDQKDVTDLNGPDAASSNSDLSDPISEAIHARRTKGFLSQ